MHPLNDVSVVPAEDFVHACVPSIGDRKKWPQLELVPFDDVQIPEVTLLIGMKALNLFGFGAQSDGPTLVDTPLGYSIIGAEESSDAQVNATMGQVYHVAQLTNRELDARLGSFFEIEDAGTLYDRTKVMSQDDRKAIEQIRKSAVKVDGQYMVRVPWKVLPPSMPHNRHQAVAQLETLAKRMRRDPEYAMKYREAIEKYEINGHSEKVPKDEIEPPIGGASWLCHHGVDHKRKKLRVVFDASRKYDDISLNKAIFQGPDLLAPLLGILLRFRQNPVAVTADIASFFHCVLTPPEDRDFARYLWFEGGNPNARILEMRMKVHLFGGVSSQTCAVFAVHKTFEDAVSGGRITQQEADDILHDLYSDDLLKSFMDVPQAIRMMKLARCILGESKFNLTKFCSNIPQVVREITGECSAIRGISPPTELDAGLTEGGWMPKTGSVPADPVGKEEEQTKSLNVGEAPNSALGIRWATMSDEIIFGDLPTEKEVVFTKRGLLSAVMSVYDPLGLLSPIVTTGKMLLRSVFERNLQWDTELPVDLQREFRKWLACFKKVGELRLPRCTMPSEFGAIKRRELHIFCDSALPAFGCIAYLRIIDQEGLVSIQLLIAKTRICPKQGRLTIPRIELSAAVLAARILVTLRRELNDCFDDVYLWSDSTAVLAYLKNVQTRFHIFLGNRIQEIRATTSIERWRHVPGVYNPADVLTRPFNPKDGFNADHKFYRGPAFLYGDESTWPITDANLQVDENDPEVRKEDTQATVCLVVEPSSEKNLEETWFVRYGDLFRLKLHAAAWLRLKDYLRRGSDGSRSPMRTGRITLAELNAAESAIIQTVQRFHYSVELEEIGKGRPVPQSSPLAKFKPIIKDKLLRVGGRLSTASLPFEWTHPAVLSKAGHLTDIIVRAYHRSGAHGTLQMVVNDVRCRFHIPSMKRVVQKIIGRCLECRRYTQRVLQQEMADIPKDRLQIHQPAFHSSGVDIAGPFLVKRARSEVKRYLAVFTCLTMRAVHIEVLESLESSSFMNACRRFFARRGPIAKLRSDNGTTFRGSERQLREAIREWNESVADQFLQKGVEWSFQTPYASSQSGIWERIIRAARWHLRHILKQQVVGEETFHTVVVEVEAILNSRPLLPCSDDPNDLDPITPSQLLNLKPSSTLPPGIFVKEDGILRNRYRQCQYLADLFWKRFKREYLVILSQRQKWIRPRRNLKAGDLVLVVDANTPRSTWPLARVVKTFPGRDGRVRNCQIQTSQNVFERPIQKLVLLEGQE